MTKPNPLKVCPAWADEAARLCPDRTARYSAYITICFRNCGRLAPGCDNRDLQAWYDEQEAAEKGRSA